MDSGTYQLTLLDAIWLKHELAVWLGRLTGLRTVDISASPDWLCTIIQKKTLPSLQNHLSIRRVLIDSEENRFSFEQDVLQPCDTIHSPSHRPPLLSLASKLVYRHIRQVLLADQDTNLSWEHSFCGFPVGWTAELHEEVLRRAEDDDHVSDSHLKILRSALAQPSRMD